jgi:hypothetical protein
MESRKMSPSEKIRFKCPFCNKAFSVLPQYAGKRGKCPGCGQTITIPAIEEPSDKSLQLNSVEQPHSEQKEMEAEIKKPPPFQKLKSVENVFRMGNIMVMQRSALLPNRCVKTNDTEDLRFKKITLRWHHPLIYLTILAGLLVGALIYVIVASICTKKATIDVSVSQRVLRKRLIFLIATWVCVFLGVFEFGYAIYATGWASNPGNIGLMVLFSVLMFFTAALIYFIGGRIITASKIDDYYIWIKGVNSEYLSGFPQWQYGYVGAPAGSIGQMVSIAGKKCNQCGNNVSVTDQFCWRCGVRLQ